MLRRTGGRGAVCTAAVAVLLLLTSGCSDSSASPVLATEGARSSASLEGAGPWREEFRAALEGDVSAFEVAILEDGRVTPAELESAHDRVGRCLADSGFGIEYDPDGGFAVNALDGEYSDDFFEKSDPALRACEKQFDERVTMLFESTRRNPEKRDDAEITVPCLQRAGLVGDDYTEGRWRDDDEAGRFPFDETSDAAAQCRLDPLGLWRTP